MGSASLAYGRQCVPHIHGEPASVDRTSRTVRRPVEKSFSLAQPMDDMVLRPFLGVRQSDELAAVRNANASRGPRIEAAVVARRALAAWRQSQVSLHSAQGEIQRAAGFGFIA